MNIPKTIGVHKWMEHWAFSEYLGEQKQRIKGFIVFDDPEKKQPKKRKRTLPTWVFKPKRTNPKNFKQHGICIDNDIRRLFQGEKRKPCSYVPNDWVLSRTKKNLRVIESKGYNMYKLSELALLD